MSNFYLLKSGCCDTLHIILCDEHLAIRRAAGWTLVQHRGPDNQPCWDCIKLGREKPSPHKAFEGHKPSVVGERITLPNPNGSQTQGTAAVERCCGKHG